MNLVYINVFKFLAFLKFPKYGLFFLLSLLIKAKLQVPEKQSW